MTVLALGAWGRHEGSVELRFLREGWLVIEVLTSGGGMSLHSDVVSDRSDCLIRQVAIGET